MKAIICIQFGPIDQLQLQEVADPLPAADEILVQVHACSVNFPDTLIVQGLYQYKPKPPFSPGSDIAGTVLAMGEKVKGFKVGGEIVGFASHGGYAEKAVVKANACFPKPPGMDMVKAAAFMMAYGTSYHALKDRARLKEGDTMLVLGAAGGVGLTAVELGHQMGARVIAAASTAEKLAVCQSYGAELTINYTEENLKDRVKELTAGKGVDVVYDPVGGQYSEAALRTMGWNGRYLVVGFAAGDIPKIPLNLPLLKGCQIVGVFWGAFATKFPGKNMQNTMELIQWFAQGKLKPQIHATYPLADAVQALQDIQARKVKGKAVIVM
ncbi:MAG: NADPH:quinone oxidoreductase family protein [Bacteroidota bacterium]